MDVIIARHCVAQDEESGLSPLQQALLTHPAKVRIAEAPTGAGKSYAFQQAMVRNEYVLFIVPTRRLAQNLISGLLDSLIRVNGWEPEVARSKLSLWSSDETQRLKEAGVVKIGAHRIREIYGLNPTAEGGEMIIAVPEVVSSLLLRPRLEKGQADVGVFHLLSQFDHIVFDEFHTITSRGFGLAGLLAKLASEYPGIRARISFLSATPLDIRPVLQRLEVPENEIAELHEELTAEGRAVHGNVRLSFRDCADLATMVREQTQLIAEQLDRGRQIVIIYDSVFDLQRQLSHLEETLRQAGIAHGRTLVIDSIDDSRTGSTPGFFSFGRHQPPEQFDVLVATASVEMGVTFRSDLLFMEPGVEPLNFLQRYGRAARGDHEGLVLVRLDSGRLNKTPWLRDLKNWAQKHQGQVLEIGALTDVLTRSKRKEFKDCPEEGRSHFGKLPNRAAFSAGLYWNVLVRHKSNKGFRREHLLKYQPKPAKKIYILLRQVREMEKDRIFGNAAKEWCDRFEKEAQTLRDIGARIRVVIEETGESLSAPELWLRRNSDILERFPLVLSADGTEEVRIRGDLRSNLLEERRFIRATRNVRFPHTLYTACIPDDSFLIDRWCREFRESNGAESLAWDLYPNAMEAAEKLVRWTGLVVSDADTEPDTAIGVF